MNEEGLKMERQIKFTVIAKKWFDKINGNTYHSVRCIRCSDGAVVVGPFQYGYGEHYRYTALTEMWRSGWLPKEYQLEKNSKCVLTKSLFDYERENNYPILWTVSEGLKRDCVANGKL
jgi:hypothetical protein